MPFAWEKANGCRGISVNRSILYYIAWTWLAGDFEFSERLATDYERNFKYYGKPQLVRICEQYGIDWRKLDNGRWVNSEGEKGISADQALAEER